MNNDIKDAPLHLPGTEFRGENGKLYGTTEAGGRGMIVPVAEAAPRTLREAAEYALDYLVACNQRFNVDPEAIEKLRAALAAATPRKCESCEDWKANYLVSSQERAYWKKKYWEVVHATATPASTPECHIPNCGCTHHPAAQRDRQGQQ